MSDGTSVMPPVKASFKGNGHWCCVAMVAKSLTPPLKCQRLSLGTAEMEWDIRRASRQRVFKDIGFAVVWQWW